MTSKAATRPNWIAGGLSAIWLVIIGVPILSMVVWSLTTERAFRDAGPVALPDAWTLDNLGEIIDRGFLGYYWNTTIVTVGSIVLALGLAIPAAYGVVRSTSWLASASFRVFLLGLAIPSQAVIVPLYWIITELGLYDTLIAVILPTVAFNLPLIILILSGALRDVPREVYEAMTLDGAGPFRILVSAVVPMSRGSISAVGIFVGLHAWNAFIFPLIFIRDKDKTMVTLGLRQFQQEFAVDIPGLMMAVLVSAIPVFLLYAFARRWLIAGLSGLGGR